MMVAVDVWDAVGAGSAGLKSALITSAGNAPLTVPGLPQPNIVVPDLEALGRWMSTSGTVP
jgi:2-haloacid dehalogenase